MQLRAIKAKVIVNPDYPPEQTESGIALPAGDGKLPDTGTVVSAGPDTNLAPGDRVLFRASRAYPLNIEDHKYVTLDYDDIHGVFE